MQGLGFCEVKLGSDFRSSALGSIVAQRDQGVLVDEFLKVASQVTRAVKAAYGTLASISQRTADKSWDIMLQLYITTL